MSTTTIDHAIAIAAPQSVVWVQISDLSKNPRWQANCESVSYLTTMHSGRGTRWRMHTRRGVEYVLEITAWYDRLGYEYVIVDGAPYANSRGRLRLQEAPEGTVVQWTFNYEMKGLLSGLRNSLNVRRSLDREIIESLQNLYTYIKELSPEEAFTPESTKSLIQEAPDVMQRANYQPRHPSALDRMKAATLEIRALDDEEEAFEGVSVRRSNSGNSPSIFEPPVEDDDTRPNPAIAEPADEQLAEPDFLQDASFTAKEPDESLRLPLLDDEEVLEESTEAAPTWMMKWKRHPTGHFLERFLSRCRIFRGSAARWTQRKSAFSKYSGCNVPARRGVCVRFRKPTKQHHATQRASYPM